MQGLPGSSYSEASEVIIARIASNFRHIGLIQAQGG